MADAEKSGRPAVSLLSVRKSRLLSRISCGPITRRHGFPRMPSFLILSTKASKRFANQGHGLDEIMIGIESGDDEVLSFVNKGCTSEEIIEAGLPYEVIFFSGLGGAATVSDTPKRVLTSSISCTLTGSLLQDSPYSPIRRS